MRALTMGLFVVGLTAGACDRASTSSVSPAGTPDTAVGATPAASPDTLVPVGTGGVAERDRVREITIPTGTSLSIVLDTSVGSDTSTIEQPVQAHLARAVSIKGEPVLPQGSRLTGVVTDATRSGRVKGLARVAVRFNTLVPDAGGERYSIHTGTIARTAASTKKKDALEIGAPAAGGAIIGALVGGKKGALIGTAAGGGAGTAVVLSTRGKEIHLPKGSALTIRLSEPLTVRIKG
jgi:hypothetical protein